MPAITINDDTGSTPASANNSHAAIHTAAVAAYAAAPDPDASADDVRIALAAARAAFADGRTRQLAWRKDQLRKLHAWVHAAEARIADALAKDLGRSPAATLSLESMLIASEATHAVENLDDWAKPKHLDNNLFTLGDNIKVERAPRGVVLILGPWNYPLQLMLVPLVAAIAAGNTAVLKPSEITPYTARLMREELPKVLDPQAVRVVTGGPKVAEQLLAEKFDLVFFTGSPQIGRIVMQAAAKNLTPVVLELGGKCPVYVDAGLAPGDLRNAARRIMWGKTLNNGQTCISPDYVLVHRDVSAKLCDALREELKDIFAPSGPKAHPNLSRMATVRHTERLAGLLRRQLALPHSRLVAGGDVDAAEMYFAPTVVGGVRDADPLMEEELFGPVLPVVEVTDVDDAVARVNARPHPLASYVFGPPAVAKRFVDRTRSGASIINDVSYHVVLPELPFGGVGESGVGAYHGREGFLSMTQPRPVMHRNKGLEVANSPRYPNNVDKPFMVNLVKTVVMAGPRPRFVIVLGKFLYSWGFLIIAIVVAFVVGWRIGRL
ncbi:hypothetical protein HK405_006776 [Cladochytrium tenue]|nr:hypothetical protein HK405_006776 [Cladochytrium tenue]